jgi:hypothetical protein
VTFVSELAAGDPTATRTVYSIVAALGLIGVALIALAIWVVKQTRPDRELLAPLELMGDRKVRQQDPVRMRRALDDVRPAGAEPVSRHPDPPDVDEQFAQRTPTLASFDDLVEVATSDGATGERAAGAEVATGDAAATGETTAEAADADDLPEGRDDRPADDQDPADEDESDEPAADGAAAGDGIDVMDAADDIDDEIAASDDDDDVDDEWFDIDTEDEARVEQ